MTIKTLNFSFIEQAWPMLAKEASLAEEYVHRDPESALVKLRRFCEIAVDIVYDEYNLLPPFPNAGLFDLLENQSFIDKVPDDVREKLSLLRKSGNRGAHVHRFKISAENACLRLREAWDIGRWLYLASKKGTASDFGGFKSPRGHLPLGQQPTIDSQTISLQQQKINKQSIDNAAAIKTIGSAISNSLKFDKKATENLNIDTSQAGFCSSFEEFISADNRHIVEKLREYVDNPGDSQIAAWRNCVSLLKPIISHLIDQFPNSAKQCSIIFEYTIPLETRRIDVLLLVNGTVVVLEFKGHPQVYQADIDQVAAYARDLRAYHRGCSKILVTSFLVLTRQDCQITRRTAVGVKIINCSELADYLISILQKNAESLPLSKILDHECYRPLPTLVKAARELFSSGNVHRVHRAATATEPTLKTCTSIIKHTARLGRRSLILICGVPGAGKTLVGLQLAHSDLYVRYTDLQSSEESTAVFLSGNGPLVEVLQYELRSAGGGGKAFVRGVHEYVKTFTKNAVTKIPHHVLIYDEAQRAFDADQVREKHRNMPAQFVGLSEPELFIQFAERLPNWCVVVGLIGTGQEIHVGEEAGIGQWRDAIIKAKRDSEWDVYVPIREDIRQAFAGVDRLHEKPQLELATTIRFHLATELYQFVEYLLDGRQEEACKLSDALKSNNFNMVITHDLEKAKQYLHARYTGDSDARYGMVASAKDKDLPQWGVEKGFRSSGEISPGKYGQWYGEPFGSGNSCTNLNTVVTEFGAQGLELDACLLAWGTDFIRENNFWSNRFASGYQNKHRIRDAKNLRKNAYRVLLTRGRDGCVIYVPPDPDKMRETYKYLAGCGFEALE